MNTIKDRIGQHEVLLPINHNYYNLRKKKEIHIYLRHEVPLPIDHNQHKIINLYLLEKIFSVETLFCRVSGCCYIYRSQLCDWGIWRSDLLSDYRSRITVDRPIALSDRDKAVKEWKTFEDVVMVMTGRGGERGETVMFCYYYNS